MDYTKRIAEFIVGIQYDHLPRVAVERPKDNLLDSVGVALAGSRDDSARIAAGLAREEAPSGRSGVFGRGFRTSASMAALANGAAGHALDFDASFAIMGQPMSALGPAAFALAEPREASGRQLLEAYGAGFELAGKLAWCNPSLAGGGWHSTGVLGTLGATAVCSRLLGLDVDQTAVALGIGTSMASGSVFNFGTMTKPLHAGLAARNGVLAAQLAAKGFSANSRMFEGPRGFFQVYAGEGKYDLQPLDELGMTFELERGMRFKPYPCGGLVHPAIDAALALRAEYGLTPETINHIDVKVTAYTAGNIIYGIPETELQAKFSTPYLVARAIVDGDVTLDAFSDEAIHDPAVIALAERITQEVDPTLEENPSVARPCTVEIHLKDGRSLFRRADYATGGPEAPLTHSELAAKFQDCARRVLSQGAVREAMRMIEGIDALDRVDQLTGILMGTPARR